MYFLFVVVAFIPAGGAAARGASCRRHDRPRRSPSPCVRPSTRREGVANYRVEAWSFCCCQFSRHAHHCHQEHQRAGGPRYANRYRMRTSLDASTCSPREQFPATSKRVKISSCLPAVLSQTGAPSLSAVSGSCSCVSMTQSLEQPPIRCKCHARSIGVFGGSERKSFGRPAA